MKSFQIFKALSVCVALLSIFSCFTTYFSYAQSPKIYTVCPTGCAFSSVQSAINAASAGDTVLISPGVYKGSLVVDKNIILKASVYDKNDARKNTVIIDGNSSANGVITIPSNISGNPQIIGLVLKNAASGILAFSPFTVEHSFLTGADDLAEYEKGSGGINRNNVYVAAGDDAIDLDNQVRDITIENNLILNSRQDGIEVRLQDDVIVGEPVKYMIKNNRIEGNGTGGDGDGLQIIDYDKDTNRIFYISGNLFLNNRQSGIGLMCCTMTKETYEAASIREEIQVIGNTFFGNNHGITGGDNMLVLHNIFTKTTATALKNIDNASVTTHNLFWQNGTDAVGTTLNNAIKSDPLLDSNYLLRSAGSQAVNTGIAGYAWRTLAGTIREVTVPVRDASPDLGWKEFGEAVTLPISTSTPLPTFPPTTVPSTDIIKELVVYDSARAGGWSVQSNIQVSDRQYSDLTYLFGSMPSIIRGSTWIRTATGSKAFSGDPLASFKTTKPAEVFIAHNTSISPKPAWLSSWENIGFRIENNESTPKAYTLFRKIFSAGSTVILGPNGSTSHEMYTVIIKENVVSVPSCDTRRNGDADCSGSIDLIDFEIFRSEFIAHRSGKLDIITAKSDFNTDTEIDLLDFELFRSGYMEQRYPSPTVSPPQNTGKTTYFIDCASGNDSNNGISATSAWKTLGRANTITFKPGESLLLKKDCSWSSPLTIQGSGTTSSGILISSFGSGLKNPEVSRNTNGAAVSVKGAFITIENINTKSASTAVDANCLISPGAGNPVGNIQGFTFESGSHHNTLKNSMATGFYAGVFIRSGSYKNKVTQNKLLNNTMMSPLTPGGSGDAGAFGVLIHGDENDISNNEISGSDACSYDYVRDGAAVEIYGGSNNIIHHNMAKDSDAFTELGKPSSGTSTDNTFTYNVFISTKEHSIFLNTRGTGSYGPILRTRAYNNSVFLTGKQSQGIVCSSCGADILTLKNNILWANGKSLYTNAAFDESNNIYWKDGGSPVVQSSISGTSLKQDPLFLDRNSGNLRLSDISPAINAGSSETITKGFTRDYENKTVPLGNTVDIGAFEKE